MSTVRAGQPGATRVCPHCKATVLESAAVCPGCRHHLRFNTNGAVSGVEPYSAFSVDGTIAHKVAGEPCEYCVVLDIRNERGEQVLRQVVGVGALQPGELRRLNVAVEMLPVASQGQRPAATGPRETAARTGSSPSPASPRAAPAPASPPSPAAAAQVPSPASPAAARPAPTGAGKAATANPSTSPPSASPPADASARPAGLTLNPPRPGAPAPQRPGLPTDTGRLRLFRKS